jgi:uncharacterized small protein (DUF1192 family)
MSAFNVSVRKPFLQDRGNNMTKCSRCGAITDNCEPIAHSSPEHCISLLRTETERLKKELDQTNAAFEAYQDDHPTITERRYESFKSLAKEIFDRLKMKYNRLESAAINAVEGKATIRALDAVLHENDAFERLEEQSKEADRISYLEAEVHRLKRLCAKLIVELSQKDKLPSEGFSATEAIRELRDGK